MPIRNVLATDVKGYSKTKKSDSDRQKEKDDYDGTDDTFRMDLVGENKPQKVKEPSGKRRIYPIAPTGIKRWK